MRFGGVVFAAGIAFATAAWGAPGDALIVNGDGVNVRAGPSTNDEVRLRVYRGQQVIELERQGDWVRAEISGAAGSEGWIHGSLLAPSGGQPLAAPPGQAPSATATAAAPAPSAGASQADDDGAGGPPAGSLEVAAVDRDASIAPGAGPEDEPVPVRRFRETVDYLNNRAVQVAGVDLFTGVSSVNPSTVRVVTTDAWTTVPPAGQRSYLNTLVDRWAAAQDDAGGEVRVQIVDTEGSLLMEEGSAR